VNGQAPREHIDGSVLAARAAVTRDARHDDGDDAIPICRSVLRPAAQNVATGRELARTDRHLGVFASGKCTPCVKTPCDPGVMNEPAGDDWTIGFFDDPYTQLFPFPNAAQTEKEIDALLELLASPPARILDVACGQGRHAIRLARRGFQVVGIDTSTSFLAEAHAAAAEAEVDVEFVQLDMRDLDFDHEFDAALSLFTAWGYFDDEANQEVLDRIARSLRPDGRVIVDLIHRDWLMRVYEPKDWVELADGAFAVADRTFDPVAGVNTVTHRWRTPTGELRERQHRLRIQRTGGVKAVSHQQDSGGSWIAACRLP
jgi:SAM-dependent methyltransferase